MRRQLVFLAVSLSVFGLGCAQPETPSTYGPSKQRPSRAARAEAAGRWLTGVLVPGWTNSTLMDLKELEKTSINGVPLKVFSLPSAAMIRTPHTLRVDVKSPDAQGDLKDAKVLIGKNPNTVAKAMGQLRTSIPTLFLFSGWVYLSDGTVEVETIWASAHAEGTELIAQIDAAANVHRFYFLDETTGTVTVQGVSDPLNVGEANRYVEVGPNGFVLPAPFWRPIPDPNNPAIQAFVNDVLKLVRTAGIE